MAWQMLDQPLLLRQPVPAVLRLVLLSEGQELDLRWESPVPQDQAHAR